MKAILLVDHGSRKTEANDMLICMSNLVQAMAGSRVIVRPAHMELAEPSIPSGLRSCVEAGATDIIVFPYMLSPGKHSTGDIPRMVAKAATDYPGVTFTVTPAFGVHEKLGEVILSRASLEVDALFAQTDTNRCWDPACSEKRCGDACRSGQSALEAVTTARTG